MVKGEAMKKKRKPSDTARLTWLLRRGVSVVTRLPLTGMQAVKYAKTRADVDAMIEHDRDWR